MIKLTDESRGEVWVSADCVVMLQKLTSYGPANSLIMLSTGDSLQVVERVSEIRKAVEKELSE